MGMRINRFLSQAGFGSRRAVEDLVREGRVRVNGETLRELGARVNPPEDAVEVDGHPARLPATRTLLLLHKPVGVVSSFARQDQRPCLLDLLPEELWRERRLFHLGRLDHDSSGLLLLSDDGDLAQALVHPRHEVWKGYEVEVDRTLDDPALTALREGGIELDGRPCLPARVETVPGEPRRLRLQLREGRNRQIRRMVEAVGGEVISLHRTAVGPLRLGDLAPGDHRAATDEEWEALRRMAGGRR